LKFKRPGGFAGSTPRTWIDRQLPRCPFCGSSRPEWEMAMEFKLGLNRYHFRCQECHGTLSIPVASIAHVGGIGGMMISAGASKDLMIESKGRSESSLRAGAEYQAATLRAASNAQHRPEPTIQRVEPRREPTTVYVCPNCDGAVTEDDIECPHCHTTFEEE